MDCRHEDDAVKEVEMLLRRFTPRQPPPLRGPLVTPARLAAAAAVLAAAAAVPFAVSLTGPGASEDAISQPLERPAAEPPGRPVATGPVASPQADAQGARGPLRVGGAIRPPRRIINVNPVYPEDAQAAGIEGVVILSIIIAENGSVRDALVLRSVEGLDQAAIDAVLQWVYEPTLINGEPVELEMTVTVNFTLRQ